MEMLQTHCYATGTVTLPWKCHKPTVMQQQLLRYYGNALKDLTCHNIIKEMMFKLHSEEIIDCSIGFVLLGDYVMQAPCNNRLYYKLTKYHYVHAAYHLLLIASFGFKM
jgi:hypothetical protein